MTKGVESLARDTISMRWCRRAGIPILFHYAWWLAVYNTFDVRILARVNALLGFPYL